MDRASRRFLGVLPSGWWLRPGDAERLGPNAQLKDSHRGQRCFILGNGPSLESERLDLVKGHTVFTANQGYRFAISKGVSPEYHAIVDEHFLRGEYDGLFADLRALQQEHGTTLLTGTAIADALLQMWPDLRVHQTRQFLISNRALPAADRLPDMTMPQFGFLSVIHMAIAFALYMGFKDICLLGCDMDYFVNPAQPIRHAGGPNRFGPDSTSAQDLFGWDQIEILRWCLEEFEGFRELDRCARQHGRRVVNAGTGGSLNTLERIPLAELAERPVGA